VQEGHKGILRDLAQIIFAGFQKPKRTQFFSTTNGRLWNWLGNSLNRYF